MSNKGIMKTAIIYFEGKDVCYINFNSKDQLTDIQGFVLWTKFNLNDEEVGFFTGEYCYEIVENVK